MKTLTTLKQTITWGFISSIVILTPLGSQALTVEEVTNPRQNNGGWVTDMADILSNVTETEINRLITDLEQINGTEIAVVTVPDVVPAASPKAFATKLFNYWGIGKAGVDNGVLFLVSVSDRRVEIETGYGVESILPDAKVGNIINTKITPQYKQGDFDRGTLDGTKALIVALEPSLVSFLEERSTTGTTSENSLSREELNTEKTTDSAVPWKLPLAGGGGLAFLWGTFALWKLSRRVFVRPEGRSRLEGNGNRPVYCAECKQPMERLNESQIQTNLSNSEKIARNIGSLKFEYWKCSNCSQQSTGEGFHSITYASNSSRFRKCPTCRELTVTRTKRTIRSATQYRAGKRLITDKCHCCDYHQEKEEKIPRLPSTSSSSSSISSSISSSSYSGGGSSCGGGYGGGSSGGGSFGGGSSGGGGAGGGW